MEEPTEIALAGFPGFGSLGEEWQALESRAPAASFFQSWTWVGCLAEERFSAPVLVRARQDGRTVGLALFNRRGGGLHLGESGDPVMDAVYVEHNAPLVARDTVPDLAARLVGAGWTVPGARRLVLSGVPPSLFAAAGGLAVREQLESAPFVDLSVITGRGSTLLESLSANSRAQLRRSMRHFRETGPLALARPESDAEAAAWFAEMAALHTGRWEGKGRPGAFATGFMRRFHAELIARASARGELDLLRLAAGGETLGYLYNLRQRGTVHAYQSGFRQFPGIAQARPGLVAHAMAAEQARLAGLQRYDFLAGAARYKLSLANDAAALAWGERVPRSSLAAVLAVGRGAARALRDRLRAR